MSKASAILALSGGVGGAKLARGLSALVPGAALGVVANIGDDFDHLGLRICPDIDSLLYRLSGHNDDERGWGRSGETWNFMSALAELGGETWFRLGDRDLSLHIERTRRLQEGNTLSEVTAHFATRYGISARILPVSDDSSPTTVLTESGEIPFQHYFVREQCRPKVFGIRFESALHARVSESVCDFLNAGVEAIVICPSNPFISIDPILAIGGFTERLRETHAPIVAVSPIVKGTALKGPAAKMLNELGYACSATGVAKHYAQFVDGMIIDEADSDLVCDIEAMGIPVAARPSIMKTDADMARLAEDTLAFARNLKRRGH